MEKTKKQKKKKKKKKLTAKVQNYHKIRKIAPGHHMQDHIIPLSNFTFRPTIINTKQPI
jgi:hypothetical protein